MTVKQRVRAIRLMEKMQAAYDHGNGSVNKTEDGTLQYINNDGEVLFGVKMTEKAKS